MNIQQLEEFSPGHWFYDVNDQLKRHVYQRSMQAFAAGDAARDAITTREALEARQQALRAFFLTSLGGLPPSDTPLQARIVGVIEEDGLRVEKVIFQSRPRHYVTANLYLPDASPPFREGPGVGPPPYAAALAASIALAMIATASSASASLKTSGGIRRIMFAAEIGRAHV